MVQTNQCVVLGILVLAVEIELSDGIHRDLVPLQLDLVGPWGKVVDMRLDLVTKGGREQHQLTVGGQSPIWTGVNVRPGGQPGFVLPFNLQNLWTQRQLVHHGVGFVEDEYLDGRCLDHTP